MILKAAESCFIEDSIIWKRLQRPNKAPLVVIYLPLRLIPSVLQEAHCTLLSGKNGILKTKERVMPCYFWPGIVSDIQQHIQQCTSARCVAVNFWMPRTHSSHYPSALNLNESTPTSLDL